VSQEICKKKTFKRAIFRLPCSNLIYIQIPRLMPRPKDMSWIIFFFPCTILIKFIIKVMERKMLENIGLDRNRRRERETWDVSNLIFRLDLKVLKGTFRYADEWKKIKLNYSQPNSPDGHTKCQQLKYKNNLWILTKLFFLGQFLKHNLTSLNRIQK
jgi:hypothetical protein